MASLSALYQCILQGVVYPFLGRRASAPFSPHTPLLPAGNGGNYRLEKTI